MSQREKTQADRRKKWHSHTAVQNHPKDRHKQKERREYIFQSISQSFIYKKWHAHFQFSRNLHAAHPYDNTNIGQAPCHLEKPIIVFSVELKTIS